MGGGRRTAEKAIQSLNIMNLWIKSCLKPTTACIVLSREHITPVLIGFSICCQREFKRIQKFTKHGLQPYFWGKTARAFLFSTVRVFCCLQLYNKHGAKSMLVFPA